MFLLKKIKFYQIKSIFISQASCMTEKEAYFLASQVKSSTDKFYVGISDL